MHSILPLPARLTLLALLTMATLPAGAALPGDVARGRALLLQRQDSGCILCHVLPGLPPGGALGPPLVDLARRYDSDALRLRIADARSVNPDTVMPPYFSTEGLRNVARSRAGLTVLSEQALADIVAYLLAAPGPDDDRR